MSTTPVLRRIVTGVNDNGKSVIVIDGPPSDMIEWSDTGGLYEIWTDQGSTDNHVNTLDGDVGPVKLTPPSGGFKVRWFTVAPADPSLSDEEAREAAKHAFASMQASDDQPDTTRHPAMHTTQTIDAIIVIRGRVRLLVDEGECVLGPGDVVMQRGTNHAWAAEGNETVLLVAVLIDRPYE